MKELEALKVLKANAILFDDGTDFGASMLQAILDLDKCLTPPTSEEVCRQLSEYYKTDVFCRKHERQDIPAIGSTFIDTFYYLRSRTDVNGVKYNTERVIVIGDSNSVSLNDTLPTHLITLIGRFYQGVKE